MTRCEADPAAGGPGWESLYRAGAVCAMSAVAAYVAALILVTVTDPPPTSGGAAVLAFVAAHRTVYVLRQLLWLTPAVLLMVVSLALAVALRERGRSFAAVGA